MKLLAKYLIWRYGVNGAVARLMRASDRANQMIAEIYNVSDD